MSGDASINKNASTRKFPGPHCLERTGSEGRSRVCVIFACYAVAQRHTVLTSLGVGGYSSVGATTPTATARVVTLSKKKFQCG